MRGLTNQSDGEMDQVIVVFLFAYGMGQLVVACLQERHSQRLSGIRFGVLVIGGSSIHSHSGCFECSIGTCEAIF